MIRGPTNSFVVPEISWVFIQLLVTLGFYME